MDAKNRNSDSVGIYDNINNTAQTSMTNSKVLRNSDVDMAELEEISNEMNLCQKMFIGAFAVFTLLLYIFIIYISATWNKDRPNEYA